MKFLIDAQLPPALARWLVAEGHEAEHVADIGMQASSDRLIWHHAAITNSVLITKDEDFVVLRTLEPNGSAIVWLRIGNTTKQELLSRTAAVMPEVLAALASGEGVVEVA